MKPRYLIYALILTLFLSACALVSNFPGFASRTPDEMPRLDPSPTPADSKLPLNCQITDLNVYIDEMDGYCFAYPKRFFLGDQPSDTPEVRGPAIGSPAEPVFASFGVEISLADPGKTLREQAGAFLADFSVADPSTYVWTQVQIGGEPGWMVEPVPAMLSWRLVFVQHGGRLFRLSYWPVDIPEAKADLDELTQTTLGSFTFTK
jgi:hypothetical protein